MIIIFDDHIWPYMKTAADAAAAAIFVFVADDWHFSMKFIILLKKWFKQILHCLKNYILGYVWNCILSIAIFFNVVLFMKTSISNYNKKVAAAAAVAHICSSYIIIIYDHQAQSYMIIIYDHHIWPSFMMIIYDTGAATRKNETRIFSSQSFSFSFSLLTNFHRYSFVFVFVFLTN